jgi:hypothetical protein
MSSSVTEARLVLAPKKKMTKKQRRAETETKLAKQREEKMLRGTQAETPTQMVLQPKQGSSGEQTVKLEAIVTENKNGEHVLQLTKESSEALHSTMQQSKEPNALKAVVVEEPAKQQVLFYDPNELKTAAGEPPLPKRVYDADGNEVDMTGKEAILIPPPSKETVSKESSQVRYLFYVYKFCFFIPRISHEHVCITTTFVGTEQKQVLLSFVCCICCRRTCSCFTSKTRSIYHSFNRCHHGAFGRCSFRSSSAIKTISQLLYRE